MAVGELSLAQLLRIIWMRSMRIPEDEIAEWINDETPLEEEMENFVAIAKIDKLNKEMKGRYGKQKNLVSPVQDAEG